MHLRILIAVTHLLGAGHLTRAAALARALARTGHAVTLVSGGRPAPLVDTTGLRLVALPSLHVEGTAFGRLLAADGAPADARYRAERRRILSATLAETAPDIVVTELFPFGRRALAEEFLGLAEAAAARGARLVASVRDILVAPERGERVAETHARVARLYDAVLVHGDPALAGLDASWPVDAPLRAKLRYTGYVDEGTPVRPAPVRAGILVSAGSSEAGLGLYRAAAEAARRRPDLGWRILVGHGVPEDAFGRLARGLPDGIVGRARAGFRDLLAGASVAISQCGYNTAVDLLAAGPRAVLVPFEAGRETEQRLRAERLAARGLARVLPEADLSADTLLDAVAASLAEPERVPEAGARSIARDGATRTVALIEDLARTAPPDRAPAAGRLGHGPAASRLRDALDGIAGRGGRLALWWRDDDAVAWTPALERLLALASGRPLLVAAMPALVEPSLAARLAAEPAVAAAVHGLAHADHAPAGAKSAEFGPHRPLAAMAAEALAALALARARLPANLLPVFVPPWNRIAPDLAARLPELGYAGLSAARGAPEVPGLTRHDIQVDPIDWRGGRGLRPPDLIVDDLLRAFAEAPDRPVGLLTHHRAHDAAIWHFLEDLLGALLAHPAVGLADPRDLFAQTARLDDRRGACPNSPLREPARRA